MATTAAPTLPSDWRPSRDGCMKSADFWIWSWGSQWKHQPTVLGGPSQTSECFPSGWEATATFEATQCPPDYTSAPRKSGTPTDDAVTCCPTAYDFFCVEGPFSGADSKHNLAYQKCQSGFTETKTNLITWVDLELSKTSEVSRPQGTHQNLFAGAIVYTTPTTTTSSTSRATDGTAVTPSSSSATGADSSSSTSSSGDGATSSGLSAGASAGIGVGVALGILLLAAAVFFLFRRRRQRRQATAGPSQPLVAEQAAAGPFHPYQDQGKPAPSESVYYPPSAPSPGLSEVPSPPPPPDSPHAVVAGRHEIGGDPNVRSELA